MVFARVWNIVVFTKFLPQQRLHAPERVCIELNLLRKLYLLSHYLVHLQVKNYILVAGNAVYKSLSVGRSVCRSVPHLLLV